MSTGVHHQLQVAAVRERGPHMPVSAEIMKLLGRLAAVAEDSALAERDPNENISVPMDLIAEADRLYRQIIGDTTADAA